ncbi:MAG TPA: CDP-glycerol glycerophosphotransferase family protein [Mycobacteriales bacterium]|nr:CDP-glycerol glycerophosphotransferase family protein [Mycobacteriales bacterium]
MTEERALDVSDSGGEEGGRGQNFAPRPTGLLVLLCYGLLPIAGVFGLPVLALVLVVVTQALDLLVVAEVPDVRVALARGQFGIATRTVAREASVVLLVFASAWTDRANIRATAVLVLAVAGLRVAYQLLLVLVRRRSVLPVETRNIDLSGIRPPPSLPDVMKRQLSERLHLLSAIALVGAVIAVMAKQPPIGYAIVGAVVAVELAGVLAAGLWLVRSRGSLVRERYLAEVHRRVLRDAPEVMLYHTGTIDSVHQVDMWLRACERLNRPVLVVLRERLYEPDLARTTLPVACIPDAVDFMTFTLPSVRVALYTANVGKTIHMLREPGVCHVFIGHGDSDKTASFNPFSRVYTQVWVAGEAGRDRYRRAAVGVRDEDIVEVGRPQLEHIAVATEPIGDRPMTVLYAPTWEGWTGDPAHTSLIRTGPALVERLVRLTGVRVLYKPHPFTGTVSRDAAAADARIRSVLSRAGGGHTTIAGSAPTIYECFNDADLLVADISSVLSDFIFSEKPYVVANLTGRSEEEFRAAYPSASKAYLLDPAGERIGAIIDLVRDGDPLAAERRQLKHYLLGPDEPDAMTRFAAAVDAAYDEAVAASPTRIAAGRED